MKIPEKIRPLEQGLDGYSCWPKAQVIYRVWKSQRNAMWQLFDDSPMRLTSSWCVLESWQMFINLSHWSYRRFSSKRMGTNLGKWYLSFTSLKASLLSLFLCLVNCFIFHERLPVKPHLWLNSDCFCHPLHFLGVHCLSVPNHLSHTRETPHGHEQVPILLTYKSQVINFEWIHQRGSTRSLSDAQCLEAF